MRILPIAEKWPKLHLEKPVKERPLFTTFRLQRRDKDYEVGEVVQPVFKTRTPQREVLGIAEIVEKELRHLPFSVKEGILISQDEAIEDGFTDSMKMRLWFIKTHGSRAVDEPLNKLTLEWVKQ